MSLLASIAEVVFDVAKTTVEYTVNGVRAGASVAEAVKDTAETVAEAAVEVFRPK
jgi:hypothetical protein